jgi:hypothetical protein
MMRTAADMILRLSVKAAMLNFDQKLTLENRTLSK